ncbi:hypothetical protein NUW54_g11981 [Trametes sanguinea]|uniref:Uncharacterized protein n=1 Tax=Trametes sanguinea TaxID=158606 RepID=A0ACC1N3N7_9APHY|nr:hypothetical protein NUW54_g11981 [Trametes sanguinea]
MDDHRVTATLREVHNDEEVHHASVSPDTSTRTRETTEQRAPANSGTSPAHLPMDPGSDGWKSRAISREKFLQMVRCLDHSQGMVDGRPTWVRILEELDMRGTSPSDAPILGETDQLVSRLYQDCLGHLRVMITAEELACPLRLDLREAHLTLPFCFSTLANFIADYFPGSAYGAAFTASRMAVFLMETTPSATSSILLAFMAGMKHLPTGAVGRRDCRSHDVCKLLSSLGRDAKEAERYYGFFLGCITRCWQDEEAKRMLMPTSPMPWSVQSLQELSLPGETIFSDFTWQEQILVPRMATSTGSVLHTLNEVYIDLAFPDIPWMGGQHDGYPVCTTLAHYVAMRRPPGAVRSLHNDAALWLSAMTFGLLEAVTRLRIPESTLLSVRQVEGQDGWETVVSGSRSPTRTS